MKLCISFNIAYSLVKLSITARVVYGLLIDMPQLYNTGWLCALLGGIFALPVWFSVSHIRKYGIDRILFSPRIICGIFALLTIYDAGVLATSISESASYMALNSTAAIYLTLPLLLLCLCCLRFNGNALGASAGIWNRILPCFLFILIILQFNDYKAEWLTPIFGPGIEKIISGSIKAAGWFCLPTPLLLLADAEKHTSAETCPIKHLGICVAAATLICIAFSMMTPSILKEELFVRTFRLETLLSNGRSGLAIQFPSIAVWYMSLFYALLSDIFASALMLQHALPGLNRYMYLTASLTAVALFTASSLTDRTPALAVSGWLYPIQIILFAILLLPVLKGERRHA